MLDLRDRFKDITIVYGARTVADLVYKHELAEWGKRPDVKLVTTVDPGGETPDWKGEIGFVPTVLDKVGARQPRHHRRRLRPADHDQAHLPGADQARLCPPKTSSPPWKTA